MEWVPTTEIVADGFTKILPGQRHEEFIRQLNLIDVSEMLRGNKQDTDQEKPVGPPGRVC